MTDQHVLLVTRDALLSTGLCAELAGAASLTSVETYPECLREIHAEPPVVLVVDVRQVVDGGHGTERFLEMIQAETAPPDIVVLTGHNCPEPIERRIACSGLGHVAEPDAGALGEAVRTRLPAADPAVVRR